MQCTGPAPSDIDVCCECTSVVPREDEDKKGWGEMSRSIKNAGLFSGMQGIQNGQEVIKNDHNN